MIFFMTLSSGIFAQDSKDPLNGHKKDTYPNGNLMREYDLSDGKLQGSYKMYSEKGVLILDQYMIDGMANGYYRTYFDNGQLSFDGYMKIDHFEGPSKEYFRSGKLKIDRNCNGSASEASGVVSEYNEEGILVSETTLSNGVPVLSKTYFADGRPKGEQSEGRYVSYWYDFDGKKHTSINGVEQE